MYQPLTLRPQGIVVLFSISIFTFCAAAQSSAPASPSLPASMSPPSQDFSQQPAIFDYIHTSIRCENDGTVMRDTRARIHVQSQAGLNFAGQLIFNYNAFNEEAQIKSVKILKPDGTSITAGPDAVQDLSAPVTRGAPVYSDAREKHVTVPGVSVGDSIEYNVVTIGKPLIPGQFWGAWDFERRMIALDEQLDLNVPKDRELKLKGPEGIEPSVKLEGDRKLYHWATSNSRTPPPVDFFKNFHFDVATLLEGYRPAQAPRVMFSTFRSWREVSDWYAQLEKDRRAPAPEIRAKSEEVTTGLKTPDEKARALFYWVSQNIRYVSLSFGVGRYQPHPAADVLANRYGDCKDKAVLLESMLEAEGLHAHTVLANGIQDVDPSVPNPLQFDHAFTFLQIGNSDLWLDPTVGVFPFGYLLPQMRGKEVLVVSANSANDLAKTPLDMAVAAEYHVAVTGVVDLDDTLDATVDLQTRGDLEVLIRVLGSLLSPEQLAKSADTVIGTTNHFLYGSPSVTGFKILNASDASSPVKVQFHVKGKLTHLDPRTQNQAQLAVELTSIPIHDANLSTLLPKADSSGSIDFHGPRSYSFTVELTFASVMISSAPSSSKLRIEKDFAVYDSSQDWKDNTFRASRSLTVRVPAIPQSDSQEYAAFVDKVLEATAIPASFTKEPAGHKSSRLSAKDEPAPSGSSASTDSVEAAPHATEAVDQFKRGQDQAKRKNWANAIAAFESAVKIDPQYPEAWRELGRAHMYAREYPEAEAAFTRYLALSPNDHLAYMNMAWALFNQGKYQQDVDMLLKRLDAAPLDGDALYRLGIAYLALHQPDKAVPALEKSTAQFPKYTSAHFALGSAYLETHQDDLAVQRFQRVLTLDDSESMLNSVAYALAEHNSSLNYAEDWSRRSIEVVEVEINNTSIANANSQTWSLLVKLSAYWDTLGWIYFQEHKTDPAEKYLLAAWQLSEDPVIGGHLGQIYEAAGRQDDAIGIYLDTLNAFPTTANPSDAESLVRKRLSGLLGGDPQVESRLKDTRKSTSSSRKVRIANPAQVQGIAQYTLIIGNDSKVTDLASAGDDSSLAGLSDSIRAATMPQSFPDTSLKAMPRLAMLACASKEQPCELTLLSSRSSFRLAPPE
ncbi:MAG: tetratricopeptide repeat protein [Candidatus Acidiferrales bacterium]